MGMCFGAPPSDERPKTKGTFKVLILGISGSGKSTFAKQMQIIHHGGFSEQETQTYKDILAQNILIGMQELVKQAEKLEIQISNENRKHARYFLELLVFEAVWDNKIAEKVKVLWNDEGIQEAWKKAAEHQLQMTQMDYLIENLERFSTQDFVPTNTDILYARQRTTGQLITKFVKDKYAWELIDVGGQLPERKKWMPIIEQHKISSVIFFACLDEYNMTSTEDTTKTKMEIAENVFQEVINSEEMKSTCKILFLNKIDLFQKKIEDDKEFASFKKTYTDYEGAQNTDEAAAHIQKKFEQIYVTQDEEPLHVHIVCALNTEVMTTVFEAIRETIFMQRMKLI